MQYNSIKITGNNNVVLQGLDGGSVTQTLESFIETFLQAKNEVIENLQKSLADKDIIQSLSNEKILRLNQELENTIKEKALLSEQIEKMIRDFSNQGIVENNDRYQEAFNLLMLAKVDEALVLLDEKALENDLKKIESNEQKAKSTRKDLSANFMLRAKTLLLKFDFVNAAKCVEKAVVIQPEWGILTDAAKFFDLQKNYFKAELFNRKALLVAIDDYQKAVTLTNLANNLIDTNLFDEARKALSESIIIRRKLAENGSEENQSNLANSLNSLFALQMTESEFENAEATILEALRIRIQLANAHPVMDADDEYRPNVAMIRCNLAGLQAKMGLFHKAEANFLSALRIYGMVTSLGNDYSSYAATIFLNLGNLHLMKSDLENAALNYIESLNITRVLAKKNPERYLPEIARGLKNLGSLYIKQNATEKAQLTLEESLDIFRSLAESAPNVYLNGVIETICELGSLCFIAGAFENGENKYNEALAITQKAEITWPGCFLKQEADVYDNLAMEQITNGHTERAEINFQKALAIRYSLAETGKEYPLKELGDTLNSFANLLHQKKLNVYAEKLYREAVNIARRLVHKNTAIYQQHLAATLKNLANALCEEGKSDEAETCLIEALGIFRQLTQNNPSIFSSFLANTLSSLALLCKKNDMLEKAASYYDEVLCLYKELAMTNPLAYEPEIVISLNNIANIQRQLNHYEEADKSYKSIWEQYAKDNQELNNVFDPGTAITLSNMISFYTLVFENKEFAVLAANKAILKCSAYKNQIPLADQTLACAYDALRKWEGR